MDRNESESLQEAEAIAPDRGVLQPADEDCQKLTQILAKQRPPYVDVLDQLGSIDFFIIDGDSLLLDCLSSCRLDLRHGGQLSHLLFLVERFFNSLKNCQGSAFEVVFFKQNDLLWQAANQPHFSLARAVLQRHLKDTLKYDVHLEYDAWWSPDWLQTKQVEHATVSALSAQTCSSWLVTSCSATPGQSCIPADDGHGVNKRWPP